MRHPWPWTKQPITNPELEAKTRESIHRMDVGVEDLLGVHLRLKALIKEIRREERFERPERT